MGIEKGTLNGGLNKDARAHIFDMMVERSLANLGQQGAHPLQEGGEGALQAGKFAGLLKNLRESHPALRAFIGGLDLYHEQCSPEEKREALDFVETVSDLIHFMGVNARTGRSMPNWLDPTPLSATMQNVPAGPNLAAGVDEEEQRSRFDLSLIHI